MNAFCLSAALAALAAASSSPPSQGIAPTLYQNTPLFPLTITRLKGDDIADVALQYYDEQQGRWLGYGLFSVARELDGTVSARIAFQAPQEGVFRLRSLAKDRAGNIEEATASAEDFEVVAVYDATPPVIELVFPRGGETIAAPGRLLIRWLAHDAHLGREKCVRVLLSTDAGASFQPILPWAERAEEFEYELPDLASNRAIVAIEVKDLANNIGRKESGTFTVLSSRRLQAPALAPPQASKPAAFEVPTPQATAKRSYTRGVIYLIRGDYDDAQRELAAALQADPDYLPARIDLAVALVQMGRLKEALEFLENSAKSYPDEPDLTYNAAVLHHRAGDLAEALRLLKKVLALDPERLEALWLAAECAAQLGDLDAAINWWLEVLQRTTPAHWMHTRALSYLEKSKVDLERLKAIRGPQLISQPATSAATVTGQPLPKTLTTPRKKRYPPPPQFSPIHQLESSPTTSPLPTGTEKEPPPEPPVKDLLGIQAPNLRR